MKSTSTVYYAYSPEEVAEIISREALLAAEAGEGYTSFSYKVIPQVVEYPDSKTTEIQYTIKCYYRVK